MNRDEFLRQFREALEGKVSGQVISENAAYYRNYINSQINSGKDESEVLEALGDPRLLAKTIEESSRFKGGGVEYQYQQDESKNTQGSTRGKVTHIPLWVAGLIVLVLGIILAAVVFHIFMFFLPLILIGLAVTFAYRLIKSMVR